MSNKIVVAIDFMESSINAFQHALSIAQHCDSDIVLVWVNKPASQKEKFEGKAATEKVEKAFEELVAKYQPDFTRGKITWKIREGKVYKEVTDEAKALKAMLVVTGTHGAAGFEEFWIGSNANKIVSASTCPVITIRGGINIQRPLTRIVLPLDSTSETRQKATFTGYLAKRHKAEIFILKLYTTKVKAVRNNVDMFATQVIRYFEDEKIPYHLDAAESDNISDTMIEYAKNIDANLISIMTEQESSASNLWMGPYSHQTVNHSPIPVLSIHPKQTLAGGQGF
jgi:nucleotide-binding universal stress UspA family protein